MNGLTVADTAQETQPTPEMLAALQQATIDPAPVHRTGQFHRRDVLRLFAGAAVAGGASLVPGLVSAEDMGPEDYEKLMMKIKGMSKKQFEEYVAKMPSTQLGGVRASQLAEVLFYGSKAGKVRLDYPAEDSNIGSRGITDNLGDTHHYIFEGSNLPPGHIFFVSTSDRFGKANPENQIISSLYFGNDLARAKDLVKQLLTNGALTVASDRR